MPEPGKALPCIATQQHRGVSVAPLLESTGTNKLTSLVAIVATGRVVAVIAADKGARTCCLQRVDVLIVFLSMFVV